MDSIFCGRVAHKTKHQICSILSSDKKELKIRFSLCTFYQKKKTPVEVNFDTSKMRTHLLHCLVENPNFYVVMEIIENVFTKPFPLLYFVTAERLGENLTIDYLIKKW